jgi:hypothetical protein
MITHLRVYYIGRPQTSQSEAPAAFMKVQCGHAFMSPPPAGGDSPPRPTSEPPSPAAIARKTSSGMSSSTGMFGAAPRGGGLEGRAGMGSSQAATSSEVKGEPTPAFLHNGHQCLPAIAT